jgi:signal transduction histidine kinase
VKAPASARAMVLAGGGMVLASGVLVVADRHVAAGNNWGTPIGGAVPAFALLSFCVVGARIAGRQPANPVGWILLSYGLLWELGGLADEYATFALITVHSGPGGAVAGWVAQWFGPVAVGLLGGVLPLLLPDGALPSRRWRPVLWSVVTVIAGASVGDAFAAGPLRGHPQTVNPFGVPGMSVLTHLEAVLPLVVLVAVGSLVVRYRRADQTQRLQLQWIMYALVVFVLTFAALFLVGHAIASPKPMAFRVTVDLVSLSWAGIAVAIGVAVRRHRLYAITRLIDRTLLYAALAAFVAGGYVAVVVGIGMFVGTRGGHVALSVLATAMVAVAFQPVRARLEGWIHRLVYGHRATPYDLLAELSRRAGREHPDGAVLDELARVLAAGMAARQVEIWLVDRERPLLAGAWPPLLDPEPPGRGVTDPEVPAGPGRIITPVRYRGDLLGVLVVEGGPADDGDPRDERLVADLAGYVGVVVHSVRLSDELRQRVAEISAQAAELRESRQRLVTAQDRERRRIERDLHDGAQQRLVALRLTLRRIRDRLARDGDHESAALVDAASAELAEALAELRTLAQGIHPAVLTEAGLGPALAALATRATLPVRIDAVPEGRLAAEVEAAAYFVVCEALTNATRHAHAGCVTVRAEQVDSTLRISVVDDGVGGADPTTGSGLRGLADRVGAVSGTLAIASPAGRGTRIEAVIPCG